MSKEWRSQYNKPLKDHTKEDKEPSPMYKEKLDKFNVEEFYRVVPEF